MTKDFFYNIICGMVTNKERRTSLIIDDEDGKWCIYFKYYLCQKRGKYKGWGYNRIIGGRGSKDSEHAQKTFNKYQRWIREYLENPSLY